jgi:hypothetical protein
MKRTNEMFDVRCAMFDLTERLYRGLSLWLAV